MPRDDDDNLDDLDTAERKPRGPTAEELRRHRQEGWVSGTPVVAEIPPRRLLQAQEERDRESERQRKLRLRTSPYGVPSHHADEVTGEHEVFDRAPRPEELEVVRRSQRDGGSPLTLLDGAKLLRHIEKLVKQKLDESTERERKRQAADVAAIKDFIAHPPHEATLKLQADVVAIQRALDGDGNPDSKDPALREKVRRLWGNRRTIVAVLCVLAIPALGGLSTGVSALLTRTTTETEARMKLERALEEIAALKAELGQYRRLVIPSLAP